MIQRVHNPLCFPPLTQSPLTLLNPTGTGRTELVSMALVCFTQEHFHGIFFLFVLFCFCHSCVSALP